jgi:hypothetical protein
MGGVESCLPLSKIARAVPTVALRNREGCGASTDDLSARSLAVSGGHGGGGHACGDRGDRDGVETMTAGKWGRRRLD